MHKKNLILIAPLIGLIIFLLTLALHLSEYQSADCRLSNFEDKYYSDETTIFIGHGYGSHNDSNLALNKDLNCYIQHLKEINYPGTIVFLGDYVREGNEESISLITEQLGGLLSSSYFVIGNHDNSPEMINFMIDNFETLDYKIVGSTIPMYSFYTYYQTKNLDIGDVDSSFFSDVLSQQNKNNSKDLFLLFHELVWTSCDSTLIDNEIQNVLHNYIEYQYSSNICNYYEDLLNLEKEIYFIGGDIGATGGLSQNYTYKKNKNINFIGIGMGENGRNVLVFNQNKSNAFNIINLADGSTKELILDGIYEDFKYYYKKYFLKVFFKIKDTFL